MSVAWHSIEVSSRRGRFIREAGKDPDKFEVQAFSFLMSLGGSRGQVPHFDLAPGDMQFLVALSQDANPTRVLDEAGQRNCTAIEAARALGVNLAVLQERASRGDAQAQKQLEYLTEYPNLALEPEEILSRMQPAGRHVKWRLGTFFGAGARVIHAGPPSNVERLMLFCAAIRKPRHYDAGFQVSLKSSRIASGHI